MAGFAYPVDVSELVRRVSARDPGLLPRLGIEDDDRDDQKLTAIVWAVSHGSFPVMGDGKTFHGGVDLGLPEVASNDPDSWYGAEVRAIADGECIYAESGTRTPDGYDLGRLVLRHQTPDGEDVYAVYQHLHEVDADRGAFVQQGAVLGKVGWHGDFPHLHFAVCSPFRLGGDDDLIPEAEASKLPDGEGAWNVLRVKGELDANEWPEVPGDAQYIYNPIELIRWTRGEPYLHDVGEGHLSRVQLGADPKADAAKANEKNEHKVESHLRSKVLSGCAKLVELSHDFDFPPIGQAFKDEEVVKALQRCLQQLGYDVGRFGPNHDGIDGDYGGTCERVVKKFQAALKKNATVLQALGHTADDVDESGAVDALTLLAMDAMAAALEAAPPPETQGEAPATEPAKERPKVETLPAPGAWIFDATGKTQSAAFGLRLYRALMQWRFHEDGSGTPYSANTTLETMDVYRDAYYRVVKQQTNKRDKFEQWPKLDAFPFLVRDDVIEAADGGTLDKFFVFGVPWVASGFSNCCNTQLAAFFAALGGREMIVRRDAKDVAYWAGANDLKKYPGKSDQQVEVGSGKKTKTMDAMKAFESLVAITGTAPVPPGVGANVAACRLLGIGDAIPLGDGKPYDGKFTADQKVLRYVRIGDWANTPGHSFLIGEVRYSAVLAKTGKTIYVDQSSLVGDAYDEPLFTTTNAPDAGELTDAQLQWLATNESRWSDRIDALYRLSDDRASVLINRGGKQTREEIKKGSLVAARLAFFTANCIWGDDTRTLHGRFYALKEEFKAPMASAKAEWQDALEKAKQETDKDKKKSLEAIADAKEGAYIATIKPADHWTDVTDTDEHKSDRPSRGVSNQLRLASTSVSFARFYTNATAGSS